ncbi:MAG: glycosyltransferase [Pseudomonadota bacterium]
MSARISIIIPVFNDVNRLPLLISDLHRQRRPPDQIIVVDDGSTDGSHRAACGDNVLILRQSPNRGPAAARNAGAAAATGDILAFTDSDCRIDKDWTGAIDRHLSETRVEALMGRVLIAPSTVLGDAISALGFPAGGSVGFENIWPVSANGLTVSLSTCNCAVRAAVFQRLGGFDRRFPFAGGEDSLLAYRLLQAGGRIRYCPDMVATHAAREDFAGFLRWQYKRGMSSYVFSRLVEDRRRFVTLRRWSTGNVLRAARQYHRLGWVVSLLAISIIAQAAGYLTASRSRSIHARIDHQSAVAR